MKVRIKKNGNLELTPETELENYALEKWHDGYTSNGKETLSVNLFVDEVDCAKKSERIWPYDL